MKTTFTKIVGTKNVWVAKRGRKFFAVSHNGSGYELIPTPYGGDPKAYKSADEVEFFILNEIASRKLQRMLGKKVWFVHHTEAVPPGIPDADAIAHFNSKKVVGVLLRFKTRKYGTYHQENGVVKVGKTEQQVWVNDLHLA
jgi:hypothetical protein